MQFRAILKKLLRRAGYDIHRFPRMQLLRRYGVDLVLDVGASTGGYALELRDLGYHGRIVSFEPRAEPFAELAARAGQDPGWEAVHAALGEHEAVTEIHISGATDSSSLLDMLPRHLEVAPGSGYVGRETVTVHPLDALFDRYCRAGDRPFLKIDTQGYERQVIAGAAASLPRIVGVQMELSLVPLYDGAALLPEMVDLMTRHGFTLLSIEPGLRDPARDQLLQVDGLFFRTETR